MDFATISVVLNIILGLLNAVSGSIGNSTVATIIEYAQKLLPLALAEAQELVPVIGNIMSILKTKGKLSDEQIASIDDMLAKVDAHFDATKADFQRRTL